MQDAIVWNPSVTQSQIDKSKMYKISIEDFDIKLSSHTQFEENGLCILVSGLRLYYLIENKNLASTQFNGINTDCVKAKFKKKSCKNVCFQKLSQDKDAVVRLLLLKIKMPPCMAAILKLITMSVRGNRFTKRFVFNCYIANLITCTKCDKNCLQDAMNTLYENDDKCVREFDTIIRKNEHLYKPPNCVKLAKDKMCYKSVACKGSNPLCNF
ncbi:late expression factor 2 [Ectropis obliqua nucleopolyhedrovirus]|uniref:Late expression factor 2 n=1 Tax=Ectropis obliqua nucleopolyhedrovirus TaxID=59376 RepID=A0EZ06_9ABAC|nr:late expression factor 2 [Ectropis obliqua nucleopolyhedrovirus]ABI35786.1 late expression factor 2 [Ectropis obliqua nucleopolyhedrovirus]AGS47948.1 late expression factor 2 [Ectropis obliqua nucleopolyhedrovirus]QWV59630.1 late expression factor 2 [Ectropis obliqua nucleopolyhedrovirus]UYO72899.1 late expression factor 2 [Ectropis obliqua nucleopolyhedrovirus]